LDQRPDGPMSVVIIGGGFAGAALAVHLLDGAVAPLEITIVETRPEPGRGVAYSTRERVHLVNGPASYFSLYPEAPEHFTDWLGAGQVDDLWSPPAGDLASCFAPRWVYGSYVTAELARAVREQKGNDAFWKLHDLLFENQKALGESDLKVYAFRVGADPVKAMAAVKQKKFAPQIDADQRLADGLEATGTPAFFINGKRLAGAQSIDKFKAIIDREEALATAAMAAKSMSAEAYYDDLVKTGKTGTFETKTPGPIPAAAPRKGAKAPRVVVQWFADLECPFCARSNATIDEVLRDYGDRVQVVWRHLPLGFHPNARPAAMAAEEVRVQLGDEAFFVFVTGAFQKKKDAGALDRNALEAVAFDVSRSTTKPFSLGNLRVALDTDKHEARIKEDEEEAKRLGIAGTPSFLVGKYFVKGAVPYSKLKAAIDKALSD